MDSAPTGVAKDIHRSIKQNIVRIAQSHLTVIIAMWDEVLVTILLSHV